MLDYLGRVPINHNIQFDLIEGHLILKQRDKTANTLKECFISRVEIVISRAEVLIEFSWTDYHQLGMNRDHSRSYDFEMRRVLECLLKDSDRF